MKKPAVLIVVCVSALLFCLMSWNGSSATPPAKKQTKQWEYATVEKTAGVGCYLIINGKYRAEGDLSFMQLAQDMNSRLGANLALQGDSRGEIMAYLGANGWELVSSSYKLATTTGSGFSSTEVLHFKR